MSLGLGRIYENLTEKDKKDLSIYEEKFKKSWAYEELYAARNVKPSFSWGLILGIIFTGIDQILFRGKLPFTLKHKHADHETLKPASSMPKIEYPKPDNVITFDKTSSVYLTGTNHTENQPVHLKLKNKYTRYPEDINLPEDVKADIPQMLQDIASGVRTQAEVTQEILSRI